MTSEDWWEYERWVFEAICRAGVRLESDEAYQRLPKTDDFRLLISDHDESTIAAYLRLDVFKRMGVVVLPTQHINHGIDYDAELERAVAAWDENA